MSTMLSCIFDGSEYFIIAPIIIIIIIIIINCL
jgi:hypothetical protein